MPAAAIEQYHVTNGPRLAREGAAERRGVLGGRTAEQVVDFARRRHAEVARANVELVHVAVRDLHRL